MKRYNRFNSNMVLIGIVAPILVFLFTINISFAYFTATTNSDTTQNLQTSVIKISLTGTSDNIFTVGNSGTPNSTYLLPGDSITAKIEIKNNSNDSVYVVVAFKVSQTVAGVSTDLINNFFSINGGKLVKITETGSTYSPVAFELAKDATSNTFTLEQNFDFWETDNSYAGAEVTYSVNAYAIQKKSIDSAQEATKILIAQFS